MTAGRARGFFLGLAFAGGALTAQAQRLELAWPTPNTAYLEGKPLETYIQPTASGEATSGLFGCIRSGGGQFHEGLDLKPTARDRRGEPTDKVFAILPGVVRYINLRSGESSYGRYLVLEHPEVKPVVYTLYAHIASLAPGVKAGDKVSRGQVIATMGRSAGGYAIPRERAHLHFEIGLWMTRDFQAWYDGKKFGSPNQHGVFNGMNLMGVDALDFYNAFRARRVDNFQEYFTQLQPAARLRIATSRVPDFVKRYPELLTKEIPLGGVAGWELKVSWTGLPFAWTPLSATEVLGFAKDEVRFLEVDEDLIRLHRCKAIVTTRRGRQLPGKDLETMLQQAFGLR